jgi:hypothetical protein
VPVAFSLGSALAAVLWVRLLAGGWVSERLAFRASRRLTSFPRSGASAMIGLWPLSFS